MSQWPMVKLGDVCTVVGGGTPKTTVPEYWGGTIPWLTPKDLSGNKNLYVSCGERSITESGLDNSSAALLPKGTVLWSSRAPIGHVAIAETNVATNQGFKSFIPGLNVDSEYLAYTLIFMKDQLQEIGTGATFKEVSAKRAKSIQIPLPPLDEQRRIAEILKRSSQQISNARQKLDHLLMISLNTMDAHFTAEAVAGDRGWSQIGDFVISTQYGTSKKANETQGIPVLRMGNITYEGELDLKDLKYVELDELERKKFNLKNGDILFNRTNSPELVGKTTVYDSQSEMTFAGYLVRVRTSEDARPEYISGFLNSSYGKAYLRNQAKSIVGMANINAKEFLKIPIPSANESEQGVFSSLYIHCRSQINLVRKKITLLEELHQSLATRAFAGQL